MRHGHASSDTGPRSIAKPPLYELQHVGAIGKTTQTPESRRNAARGIRPSCAASPSSGCASSGAAGRTVHPTTKADTSPVSKSAIRPSSPSYHHNMRKLKKPVARYNSDVGYVLTTLSGRLVCGAPSTYSPTGWDCNRSNPAA